MVKEKIIILGHTGFVGRHLYNKLRNKPMFEVYGFSSKEVDLLSLGACQKLADICDEKTTVIMALVGAVMKKTSGKADAQKARSILEQLLKE
jgi:nucleoside-diphosphate-sugar epimerase